MSLSKLTLEDLEENFDLFDDWEERYAYIIDLGRQLPPLDDQYRTEDYKVRGCISQVWMTFSRSETDPAIYTFTADSDAAIVRGLIAILLVVYSQQTAQAISAVDIDDVFTRLSLEKHISPNRRNGFYSMVERIKKIAELES